MGKSLKRLNNLSRTSYRRRLNERIDEFNNLNNQNDLLLTPSTTSQTSTLVSEDLNVSLPTTFSVVNEIPQLDSIDEAAFNRSMLIPAVDDTDFLNDSYDLRSICGDSDSDDSIWFEEDENDIFRKELTEWAKENNITLLAITKLLNILRCHGHSYLPKVGQTLLHTPTTKHTVIEVDPGYYIHIGLARNILKLLSNNRTRNQNTVLSIEINIDGVPITNSTKKQFWPILGRCSELSKYPFPIGIYYGLHKPKSSDAYLKTFSEEIKKINTDGISFSGKTYFIKINCFICDAPAQAFVKGIVAHNGYSGCGKCTQEGEYEDRLYFPEIHFEKRTDLSFKDRLDEGHHKNPSVSVLEELGIGMVSKFPGDYLHLICLGVMKKLIISWTRGALENRLPAFKQQIITDRLLNAKLFQPNEFQRRIRGLDELSYWKGTEFRTFLSYLGPVILKGVLTMAEYKNFLSLHIALRICNDTRLHNHLEIARELFIYFVRTFGEIYGEKYMSYNIHNLLHIVDDVLRYGVLENFSAYPFESALGKLKKKVRHGYKILEQVINRTVEGWDIKWEVPDNRNPILKKMIFKDENESRYLNIQTKSFVLKSDQKNCYFMDYASDILKLEYIKQNKDSDSIFICGRKFLKKLNLYDSPLDSSYLDIFKIHEDSVSTEIFEYKIEQIKCKVFVIKQENVSSAFPMHYIN